MDDFNPYQPTNEVSDASPHRRESPRSDIFAALPPLVRPVVRMGTLLSIPCMGVFLFWQIHHAAWYGVYVVAFATLVVPAVYADRIDRSAIKTLSDFIDASRNSFVLMSFVLWPLLIGCLINSGFWPNWQAVVSMFTICALSCLLNGAVVSVCVLLVGKNWRAIATSYAALIILNFVLPVIASLLSPRFAPAEYLGIPSPTAAMRALPFSENSNQNMVFGYFVFSLAVLTISSGLLIRGVGRSMKETST